MAALQEAVVLPVAAVRAAAAEAVDRVRVRAVPVVDLPATKPKVRRPTKPRAALLEEDELQLPRGNLARPACLATCQSSR